MSKAQLIALVLLVTFTLNVACAPKAPQPQASASAPAPASARAAAPAPAKAPVASARPAWEEQWEKTLAAAKEEGRVVIRVGSPGERKAITQGMQGFGISLEVVSNSISILLPKIRAERQAGLYLWDVYIGGYNTVLNTMKPEGLVEHPLDSQFILPDATDPEVIKKVWYRGVFPWVDKDRSLFITSLQPRPVIVINTNLVKEGEIKSYHDLLSPKWKGKLIMHDPTSAGGGQQTATAMLNIMGESFVREMAKTEPTLTRDERLLLDWVTMGKMAIGLSPDGEQLPEYEKLGAPLKVITPVEGGYMSAAASGVALWSRQPHPNASKVLLNWLISREGQELYAAGGNYHSLRLDVSTAHLRPEQKRQEGVKYYDASGEEASTVRWAEGAKVAREAFGQIRK